VPGDRRGREVVGRKLTEIAGGRDRRERVTKRRAPFREAVRAISCVECLVDGSSRFLQLAVRHDEYDVVVGRERDRRESGSVVGREMRAVVEEERNVGAEPGCDAVESLSCGPDAQAAKAETFAVEFLGSKVSLEEVGLPLFTLVLGLLDGFNPCSMWVLILMISLLAPLNNRPRMFAVAGTFIAVQGAAYFVFMAAWLNLFLLIGLSRISEIAIATLALLAGSVNLKDYWSFGRGISLSIPAAAKPGIYARMRRILQAENMAAALVGTVALGILVQIVELMCTSGFPALFTRILTLQRLDSLGYYAYLLLYDLAYMFDDLVILTIGIVTLSQHRLQENEGRWLKLISGLVMVALGVYLLLISH